MKSTDGAAAIVNAVATAQTSARSVMVETLARIEVNTGRTGAFTDVLKERAPATADGVDADLKAGKKLPLAGVPFAVANAFDLKGIATRAGSKIGREGLAATADAALVTRLEAAGAICVGAANMDEFGLGHTGENPHDGAVHNPHELAAIAGGAPAGLAAAIAGGMVPVGLGLDSDGGLRIAASLSGVFAIKPTYGRLSRVGVFPVAPSLDGAGVMARSVEDLTLAYDAAQGVDVADPAMVKRPLEPVSGRLERGSAGLRIAIADGDFAGAGDVRQMMDEIGKRLEVMRRVTIPHAQAALAAAHLMVMAEAASLHAERLRTRPADFDPAVFDRLAAGSLLPAQWIERAQRFRRMFHEQMLALFSTIDVILAPATPMRAPRLGQKSARVGTIEVPVRQSLNSYTAAFSLSGLPVATVPIAMEGQRLPLGVQAIAAPWREDFALRIARELEKTGLAKAPVARGFAEE